MPGVQANPPARTGVAQKLLITQNVRKNGKIGHFRSKIDRGRARKVVSTAAMHPGGCQVMFGVQANTAARTRVVEKLVNVRENVKIGHFRPKIDRV